VNQQDGIYQQAARQFSPALARLARGYEADPDKRRDLLQDIHLALWRSFEGFDARCSLRTWVYRVAHNAATTYVTKQKRARRQVLVGLEELDALPVSAVSDPHAMLDHLTALIQQLKPLDRQLILSYLEGMDAASIGDLTGLSPRNVATKIHRIKAILARQSRKGVTHDG
jgi:RNA polymerase sigma-70 factor, ECF subfamily